MPEDDRPTLTFIAYLASRKRLPLMSWGDYVRWHLEADTFPHVRTWAELQTVIEHCHDRFILKEEARSSWLSYQKTLRKAARS